MKLRLLLLTGIFCLSLGVQAQDIITKKDGSTIKVKIVEINDLRIKYYDYNDIGGLLFTMDRAIIREIEFESGADYEEEEPGMSEVYYLDDKRMGLKLNFTAIAGNTTALTYEYGLNPTSSIEATLKILGLGIDQEDDNLSGVGLALGYKVKTGSVFKGGEYRPKHLLHGAFFRPVIGVATGSRRYDFSRSEQNFTYAHLGLEYGKQWIFNNSIALELYIGFHYYGGSFESTGGDSFFGNEVRAGDLSGDGNVAGSFGLRVGGIFSKPKQATGRGRRRN